MGRVRNRRLDSGEHRGTFRDPRGHYILSAEGLDQFEPFVLAIIFGGVGQVVAFGSTDEKNDEICQAHDDLPWFSLTN